MDSIVLPRDYLRACLLLVLGEAPAHGYDVPSLLEPLGLGAADRGAVYRLLRSLDSEGLVFSVWDASPVGPSRRMYRATLAGERWAATATAGLRDVDGVMAAWLARYRPLVRRGMVVEPGMSAAS